MAVEGGTVYYILIIRNFWFYVAFQTYSEWFSVFCWTIFLCRVLNMLCILHKNRWRVELSISVLLQTLGKLRLLKGTDRSFSKSCDLFIRIVLKSNFQFKVLTGGNKQSEMLMKCECLFLYDMHSCKLIFIRLSWIYLLPINLTLLPVIFISIITSIIFWCPRPAKGM